MHEIPLGLRQAIESGRCILFIGAGIGEHLIDPDGKKAPDGKALAKELAAHFSIVINGEPELAKLAQLVQIRKGRKELLSYINKRLGNLEPDDTLRWLATLRWGAIYTTNYDSGIERAYELTSAPPQKAISIVFDSDLVPINQFDIPIYHLHGAIFGSHNPDITITESDYPKFRERRKMLFESLKRDFATSAFLYAIVRFWT